MVNDDCLSQSRLRTDERHHTRIGCENIFVPCEVYTVMHASPALAVFARKLGVRNRHSEVS
ncbi:hypothetical protein D3C79_1097440 [compost metagenome]